MSPTDFSAQVVARPGRVILFLRGQLDLAGLPALDRACARLMAEESIGDMQVSIQYFADVWYVGQSYHLEVPLAADTGEPLATLYRDFLALHDRIYGHATEQPAVL